MRGPDGSLFGMALVVAVAMVIHSVNDGEFVVGLLFGTLIVPLLVILWRALKDR